MELFLPDNHARDEVRFAPAGPQDFALAAAAWRSLFGKDPGQVEVIEGANINAANFKVDGAYLKAARITKGKEHLVNLPEIALALKEADVPVAGFISAGDMGPAGNFEYTGATYIAFAQPFTEGNFLPATALSIEGFLELWPRLRNALSGLRPHPAQIAPWGEFRPEKQSLKRLVESREGPLAGLLGSQTKFFEGEETIPVSQLGWGLHHIDLHPHNFLCRGDQILLLLDLESFRWIPAELSLGFALFKMGRKGLATGRLSRERFRLLAKEQDLEQLGKWAKLELLRRIALILELQGRHGDFSWSADLPKHMAGLKEIDFLFC